MLILLKQYQGIDLNETIFFIQMRLEMYAQYSGVNIKKFEKTLTILSLNLV